MRERMYFLVSDCGQGRDHHVEAVEPSPSFNEMESQSARRHHHQQQQANRSQIAEGFHGQGSALSLRFQSKNKNRPSQWRRDESREVGEERPRPEGGIEKRQERAQARFKHAEPGPLYAFLELGG